MTAGTEVEWKAEVKRLLRAEMARRGIGYDDLARRLAAIGIEETAVNLRNKVSRGGFSAAFLLQCLEVMGCRVVRIRE